MFFGFIMSRRVPLHLLYQLSSRTLIKCTKCSTYFVTSHLIISSVRVLRCKITNQVVLCPNGSYRKSTSKFRSLLIPFQDLKNSFSKIAKSYLWPSKPIQKKPKPGSKDQIKKRKQCLLNGNTKAEVTTTLMIYPSTQLTHLRANPTVTPYFTQNVIRVLTNRKNLSSV